MDKTAIYAGSFDPVTFGHLDLIRRAAKIFPLLIVAVARNLEKKPLFSWEERMRFLRESVKKFPRVEVDSFSGLLIAYAARRKVRVVIRGLRAISDFEYEFQMALTNRKLSPDLETVYLMPSEAYSYISSRMIKEVAFLGGDVSCFVPSRVAQALAALRHED